MRETSDPPPATLGSVIRGFAALGVATLAGQLIGFFVVVLVARRAGPENLGAYTFAQNFAGYFAIPIDLGVAYLAVREVAREPERAPETAGEVLQLRFAVMAICLAVIIAVGPLAAPDAKTAAVIPIVAAIWVPKALGFDWALQGLRLLGRLALLLLAGQLVYGALAPIFVTSGFAGIKAYAWLNVVGIVVTEAGTAIVLWKRIGPPVIRLQWRPLVRRYVRGVPLGIALIMPVLYYGTNSVMLGYLRGSAELGLYGVASKVSFNLVAIAGLWVNAFYPHAASLAVRNPSLLREHVGRAASLGFVVAFPMGVAGTFLATDLMVALFGGAYRNAGPAFALLTWAATITFLQVHFGNALLALGDERRYAIGGGLAVLASVALSLFLIPALGASGAAISTIVAEVTVILYMVARFTRQLGPVTLDWNRVKSTVAATGAMALVLLAARGHGVAVRLVAGAATYLTCALAFRAVTLAELSSLLRPAARPGPEPGVDRPQPPAR
jgi:O-antigen/teichoic acid export membrane protein